MPLTVFKASAQLMDGMQVQTRARHHELLIDEPSSLGGTDQGMNPVEALLSALGACQAIVARAYAEQFEIDLQGFRVDVQGKLDTDGFMGVKDVRCGYQSITYDIHIKTTASEEKVQEFVKFIEKTCPVGDTLAHDVSMQVGSVVIDKP